MKTDARVARESPTGLAHHRTWRGLLLLSAFLLPALVGYVVYDQTRAPVLDARVDWARGTILEVAQDSFASRAGLQAGDTILSVNGEPYPGWPSAVGSYPTQIRRGTQVITLEMVMVPLATVNLPALLGGIVVALVFWGSGLLLLLRRFEQAEIRLLFLLSQVLAIAILFPLSFGNWYSPPWGMGLSVACLFLSAPMLLHHYLTFPVRLGAPQQRRRVLAPLYTLVLVAALLWVVEPAVGRRVGMAYTFSIATAAIGVLAYVYLRRASSDQRRRLRLIFAGSLVGGLPALLFYFLPSLFSMQRIPLWAAGLFTTAAPLSYLYAVLRHSLFDIDRLLNRTLVYAALSAGILLLYLGPFLLIFRSAPGDWLAQMMVAAGLTLIVGLAFERTRNGLQRLVDRLFYGGWYDYPGVVEQVSRALATCTDRDQLREALTRQAPALMQLQGGSLWFDGEGESCPRMPASGAQFEFFFQGRLRACWAVRPHRNGDDLTDSDRRILETLACQAEIALGNVLLFETLRDQLDETRASHEALARAQRRLLRSREQERARLARELHDGPLQALIGLSMRLGLLASQAEHPAPLTEMRLELRGLLDSLRSVCAELRPPVLDTLGLVAAVRSLAEEWSSQNRMAIRLVVPADSVLRALPDDVAVNLYRVIQEALTNTARHARASRVDLRIEAIGEGLRVTIEDDGAGFIVPDDVSDLTLRGHFGLVGLRERVDLIGGVLSLESAPGRGTRIRIDWQPLQE